MNLNNILGSQPQSQPQQQSLKNMAPNPLNSNNLNNFQNLSSATSSYDTLGLLILIAGIYLYKEGMIETNGLIGFIIGTIVFFVCIPVIRNMLLAYGC